MIYHSAPDAEQRSAHYMATELQNAPIADTISALWNVKKIKILGGSGVNMESQAAKEIIKRMYKGSLTEEQKEALEIAYSALDKQTPVSRIIIEGRYFCPKCKNLMRYPGFCGCGQRVY